MRNRISEHITFRKLEILLAYMEGGSLNAAAGMLDISAVSVHRALHSLEEAMSCQLFSLQGRNLIPNEAAQVLA
ncbi:LysR family transcriptional regulator, partial [Halobellus sp. Atlit-31R]